jgi:prepilin-type N-terminal cleavage/methylation domain-containing protein
MRGSFTLVELLVVIAIMAILMALIFPIVGAITSRAKLHGWQGQSAKIKADKECVLYYLFEEQDGNVVENLATENPDRQEINGKITNAKWDKGRWSQKGALKFDGSGDYIEVKWPYNQVLTSYTVAAWVREGNGTSDTWATKGKLYVKTNAASYCYYLSGTAHDATPMPTKIIETIPPAASTTFKIGANNASSLFFTGIIDEFFILSRAMSSTEVEELFEAGSP